jgi:hypothetical protein
MYVNEHKVNTEGFSVTIYRDGQRPEDLASGVRRMQDSLVFEDRAGNGWTTFTYRLSTPQQQQAMRKGIDSLVQNAVPTMLFCPTIQSLELVDGGQRIAFIRLNTVTVDGALKLTEFEVRDKKVYRRRFLHISSERADQSLTQKYGILRSVRLTLALEIDERGYLVEQNPRTPSHFCDFPLIGSEGHVMPVIINSPDFEPDAERSGLILSGPDTDPESQKISEGGVNWMILRESLPLFEVIVRYCSTNSQDLYHLLRGLQYSPSVPKLDGTKFMNSVITPYRNILMRYPIVETEVGNRKLFDIEGGANVYFIRQNDESGTLYDFFRDYVGQDRLPLKRINAPWVKCAWEGCGLRDISALCQAIQQAQSVDRLQLSSVCRFEKLDWLNALILFIQESEDIGLLMKFRIIPNRNLSFISLSTPQIARGSHVTSHMLEILQGLGEDLQPVLVHPSITALDSVISQELSPLDVSQKIDRCAGQLIADHEKSRSAFATIVDALWPILHVLPADSSPLCKTQQEFFCFISTLAGAKSSLVSDHDIDDVAWTQTHAWCRGSLVVELTQCGTIGTLQSYCSPESAVAWLNRFYQFMQNQVALDEACIFPNQNGDFKPKSKLSHDEVPKVFKLPAFEAHGLLLREKLLYPGITTIKLPRTMTIRDVGAFVERKFDAPLPQSWGRPPQVSPWNLTLLLVHVLPSGKSSNFKRNKNLLELTRSMFAEDVRDMTETILSEDLPGSWTRPLRDCLQKLIAEIEALDTLEGLKRRVGQTFQFLHSVYDLVKAFDIGANAKLYPDERGKFHHVSELSDGSALPEFLKDALWELSEKKKDVKNRIIDRRCTADIQLLHLKKITIEEICRDIDDCVKAIHKNPDQHENPIFRRHCGRIYEDYIDGKEKAKILFPYFASHKDTLFCVLILGKAQVTELLSLAKMGVSNASDLVKENELLKSQLAEAQTQAGKVLTLTRQCQSLEAQLAAAKREAENVLPLKNQCQSLEAQLAAAKRQAETVLPLKNLCQLLEARLTEVQQQAETVPELTERCHLLEAQLVEVQAQAGKEDAGRQIAANLDGMDQDQLRLLLEKADPIGSLAQEHQQLSDDVAKLREEQRQLQESVSESKSSGPWSQKAIAARIALHSPLAQEVRKHVSQVFSPFLPPYFPFEEFGDCIENLTAMREVGFLGEAAVFKDLRDSQSYQAVIWPNQSDESQGQRIVAGDEEFYVSESGQSYDLEATSVHGTKIFVEVKSTVRRIDDGRIAHHFGMAQLQLFAQSPRQHQSVLALVFRARDQHPDIRYFSIGQFS